MTTETEKQAQAILATNPDGSIKQTKTPAIRLRADTCRVVVQGEVYYPHADEYVTFANNPTIGDGELAMELGNMVEAADPSSLDQDTVLRLTAKLEEAIQRVAKRVLSWDWTDSAGRPLGEPTPETIRDLDILEMLWLLTARETPNPKGSSTSTGISMNRTQRRSLQRGTSASSAKRSGARQKKRGNRS